MLVLKIAGMLIVGLVGLAVVLALGVGGLMMTTCDYIGEYSKGGTDWDCRHPQTRRDDPNGKRLPKPERAAGAVIVVHVGERRGWPGVPEAATPLLVGSGAFSRPTPSASQ